MTSFVFKGLLCLLFSAVALGRVPTMAPTDICSDEAPFCAITVSLCNVSFCETCENAGLCDYTCRVCGNIPTTSPTPVPTYSPTPKPTYFPTALPTPKPTYYPTALPTAEPTHIPSYLPTAEPTHLPTTLPTAEPTVRPTPTPTYQPTANCGSNAGLYQIQMFATGGKGWGGLYYQLFNYTGSQSRQVVSNNSLPSDQISGMDYVCLVDLCYKMEILGSNAPSHTISWDISTTNASSLIVSGEGATSSAIFCTVGGTIQKQPTLQPTMTQQPTFQPTPAPTTVPLPAPTNLPTIVPTPEPTHIPTSAPTPQPTEYPTPLPSHRPSFQPTPLPTPQPSVSCERGEYMTSSNTCEKCAVGKYSNISAPPWLECTQCDPGKVTVNLGLTECESCEAGKVALVDQDGCGTCEQGQYTYNSSYCVNCPLGYYAPTALDNACTLCGAGSATGAYEKASNCDSCDAGKYSVGATSNCTSCTAGTFSETAAEECIDCVAGTYSEADEATACLSCAIGTYNNEAASTNCTLCPMGKAQKSSKQTSCDTCDQGKYSDSKGASSCTSCSGGKVANGTGNIVCVDCEVGKYQGNGGLTECADCEAGDYTAITGSLYCDSCTNDVGDGYNSVAGASECNICLEGYYWGIKNTGDDYGCLACTPNAYCAAGVKEGDHFQPQALATYWIDRQAAFNDPTLSGAAYPCPRPNVCNKETIVNISDGSRRRLAISSFCAILSNYNSSECSTEASCTVGSTGALCGACETDWRFSSVSQECEECGNVMGWVEAFTMLSIGMVVAGTLWALRSGKVSVPESWQKTLGGRETIQLPLVGILYHLESGTIKVTWSTFQIIQSVSFNLNVTYPNPYQSIVGFLSFFEMDFLSMDCFQGGYLLTVMLSSVAPALLALFCWVIFCFRFFFNGLKATHDMWNQHIHVSLLIIYIFVPPVSNKQFKALDCQELNDGQSYLRADTSVDCNSEDYQQFVIADAILIAVYQSLPLLYVALLFRVRTKLNPPAPTKELAIQMRDHDESITYLKFLFGDYKPSMWFFEITDLYRRIIFVSLIPLMGSSNASKAYIGCTLSLLSTIYFRELSPFRVEFTNFLAVVAQYVILLSFMAALIIDSDSLENFGLSQFSLGAILGGSNLLIIMMAMKLAWNRFKETEKVEMEQQAKVLKVEWAAEFSKNKFRTTLQYVIERAVPSSHVLCYYYTSLKQAKDSIRLGTIPATVDENGIIVSLDGPMDIDGTDGSLIFMNELAQSWEAVLCLSLPKAQLFPLLTYNNGENRLRIIHGDVLFAMGSYAPKKVKIDGKEGGDDKVGKRGSITGGQRGSFIEDTLLNARTPSGPMRAGSVTEGGEGGGVGIDLELEMPERMNRNSMNAATMDGAGGEVLPKPTTHVLSLQTSCALRAYQLRNDDECINFAIPYNNLLKEPFHIHYDPELCELNHVKTCMEFVDQMEEIRNQCAEEGTVPLYHYTSEGVAPYIFEGGFRMSTQGQGDGGVYFSTLGPSSYELGSPEYEENIIIDCFGKERLEEYRGKHKLDVVFVYGVNPKSIEQAPGGRKNAKMISKALFETFSTTKKGSYFARPDFIKGNFVIDGTTQYPMGRKKALESLLLERKLDREVQKQLENHEKLMEKNASLVTVGPTDAGAMSSYALSNGVPPSPSSPTKQKGPSAWTKAKALKKNNVKTLNDVEEGKGGGKSLDDKPGKGGVIEMRRREERDRRAAAAEEVAAEEGGDGDLGLMVAQ